MAKSGSEVPELESWCWSGGHSSTVHRDKVYVIGGYIAEFSSKSRTVAEMLFGNPYMFVYDFSKSSKSSIPPALPIIQPVKDMAILRDAAFWSLGDDNGKLLLSQGQFESNLPISVDNHTEYVYNTTVQSQKDGIVNTYDVHEDSWGRIRQSTTESGQLLSSTARASTTFAKKAGKGFALGGRVSPTWILNPETEEFASIAYDEGIKTTFLSSMLVYHSKPGEEGTWTNEETNLGVSESGTLNVLETVGKDGVLVFLGGSSGDEWRSLDTVHVYDISQKTWHNQTTTAAYGTIYPRARNSHCSVVASSPDGTSHNIYIYGGQSSDISATALSDIWVLSIPSFQWIQIDPSNGADPARPAANMACESVGKHGRYMFVFGGDPVTGRCDANGAAKLLDLTTGLWTKEYDFEAPYEVPVVVQKAISGFGKEGAVKSKPEGGFDDPVLEELFVSKISKAQPGSKGLSTGAKAGIAVGVVAFVALLALAAFLFMRRRKAAHKYGVPASTGSESYVVEELDKAPHSSHAELPNQGSEIVELPARSFTK
ncbi:hypothetical protein BJ508DRAFT_330136 [Ascobolus immersus RN42]|uniref:Galactose oxidase n=1 Tax=Ascobolus immersus RN42 TaxID=1160509 RepID=A0A3N4I6W2_ASCIM|nr:hypothetical protein BJ508DRAFT_330136 [Ascobolus immersus RN42]